MSSKSAVSLRYLMLVEMSAQSTAGPSTTVTEPAKASVYSLPVTPALLNTKMIAIVLTVNFYLRNSQSFLMQMCLYDMRSNCLAPSLSRIFLAPRTFQLSCCHDTLQLSPSLTCSRNVDCPSLLPGNSSLCELTSLEITSQVNTWARA